MAARPIGSDEIDLAALAELLRQREYAGSIVLQILSDQPLQDIGKGVAALEEQGLAFSVHPDQCDELFA